MSDPALSAKRLISRWHDDPVAFAQEALGIEPWDRQADLLRAVATHDRVAVRSGHKTGKSTSAAILALWFIVTRRNARVIMTSSSYRQVRSILWKELRRLHSSARVPIGGAIALDPETGLQFADGREVVGFSTNEPEKMAGVSGANLLFIIDEASGVPEEIYEAVEGNRAGGAKLVLLGNPTRTSGTFFEAFHSKRDFWTLLHLSSEDTPNVREGRIVIPGLATREWVDEKRREWGEDSLPYAVRVRGDFPRQDERSLIGLDLVEAARERWADAEEYGSLSVGVDPARFGSDETAIAAIRGNALAPIRTLSSMDGPSVAGKVMEFIRSIRKPGERPSVKVDVIGIGASVYDALRVYANEIDVVAVNASSASTVEVEGRPAYGCLRDQLWCDIRDWLKGGGSLPADSQLESELVGIQYSFDMRGRLKVESKDSMKKRLGRSPDRADALALAIHQPSVTSSYSLAAMASW